MASYCPQEWASRRPNLAIWPGGTDIDPNSISDVNTIFYSDAEYQTLGEEHAKEMLEKST
jgi:hypothetical protein